MVAVYIIAGPPMTLIDCQNGVAEVKIRRFLP